MRPDLEELRRLLARPCCEECLVKAMRNALPALLAECEAGRKLREACGDMDEISDALAEYDAAVGVE